MLTTYPMWRWISQQLSPLNQHDEYDILLHTTEMTKDLILCLQGLLLGNIRHILLYTMNLSLKWDFNLLIIWTASINSGNERMQTNLYFLNALWVTLQWNKHTEKNGVVKFISNHHIKFYLEMLGLLFLQRHVTKCACCWWEYDFNLLTLLASNTHIWVRNCRDSSGSTMYNGYKLLQRHAVSRDTQTVWRYNNQQYNKPI